MSFCSVAGNDDNRRFTENELRQRGIECELLVDDSRPTTVKQRFRAAGKTLLRVSHLRQHAVNRELLNELRVAVVRALKDADLLIFSDFNYGCLPQPLVDDVAAECSARNIMMVADSQSSSQVGDVSRFKGMALLTPTEREARLAVRDFDSGLVVLADALQKKSSAKNIVLTLGAEGILIHVPATKGVRWHTDRLPAMNTSPKDPAGAGDSLTCCASMALAAGADIWQSAYLGALAAACQVGRVGNIPLTAREIQTEIEL